jgi:cell division protein FtsZ
MSEGGAALMAVGKAAGEDRARLAAEQAISSQLLDITIDGAHGILFNVTGGPDMTLFEVNQAAAIIKETAHPDVNLIFGAVIDPNMGDDIRITVIATGFERTGAAQRRTVETPTTRQQDFNRPESGRPLRTAEGGESHSSREFATVSAVPPSAPVSRQADRSFEPRTIVTEDLDIPTFLRNRKFN